MLAPSLVTEIRRLLVENNLSQRKIAKFMGVSRGTVGAIANGRRPDYKPRAKDEDKPERPNGPPRRCVTCGGMVYMPCRLCALRRGLAASGKGRPHDPRPELPLGLELLPEQRKRYEEVRAVRA
ncbi:MAG: helix-turn-helix transcriptional regulator, partial [Pirellulales bacterium]|nr:helix-turn-helix transcriptional regulator [Pirellulales bacterium]